MINVFQPSLGEEELEALREVFASNWLGYGPRAKAFEAEFAEHIGARPEQLLHINSATAGLFLATELLDLGPGDEVLLPSVSFVAAGNAVMSTGAKPVYCDIDPRTLNPTVDDVRRALTPDTRAVLLLHYGGYPGDVARIAELCRERGIALVEDAACAVSSRVGDEAVGTFGDIAVWSFDSMKVLVTGDGGMLYVRDPELARRARRLAYHGLEQSSGFQKARVSHRWWELDVRDIGRRVLGNDMTGAIGSVQLGKLPGFVEIRREFAELYDRLLADVPGLLLPPELPAGHTTSYYFYWVQIDAEVRDKVAADLLDHGIYTTFRYPPLHQVEAFRQEGGGPLPATERTAETTLLLPLHHGMDAADVHTVADEVRKSMERHTGPDRPGAR
ncbi:DegT/DnrJ/EryC1/StrS family aminotransferase [Streptomyces sp. Je 1-79]|uniref:DegT/DnrJ/EryC1/StrS family aminotransferase n=1 Tax=Streptomyces sp. Je 1-79 TaxID=2943847 RepID=UPI0021A7BA1A|nr:DegT/DnrJ/EryC1/StrS family aminotransferase [Streptomyces sp. Je 1-79]MCT4356208.1 DegT/DnrJ/EryC1/StrS family aminotransferase [Streptomyces sp. Je 1-79]